MGPSHSVQKLFRDAGRKDVNLVMSGLDGAGKTTILRKVKLFDKIKMMNLETDQELDPDHLDRFAYPYEQFQDGGFSLKSWDVGGDGWTRAWSRNYHRQYEGCDAIIFVVDSTDTARIKMAAGELEMVLGCENVEARNPRPSVLVFANKQDQPAALSCAEVRIALQTELYALHKCFVQGCCATTAEGLYEGFDWLAHSLRKPTPKSAISFVPLLRDSVPQELVPADLAEHCCKFLSTDHLKEWK